MSEAKVVLVTGSSSGIGRGVVKLLSQKGYKVVVSGSNPEKVKSVAEECSVLSPQKFQPLSLVLDFNNPDNGEVAVVKTVEHYGRLDVLINNAGIFTASNGADKSSYDTYRQVMTINTDASVRAALAAAEHLKKVNGNMVFVSSVASVCPPHLGYAYAMSKAAMSMFAKSLAIDLAPNVRVNIVSPGPVLTPIFRRVGLTDEMVQKIMDCTTLQNRVGNVEEIAYSVAFLISDEASFVNGHEMFVDGGYLVKPSSFSASEQLLKIKEAQSKSA